MKNGDDDLTAEDVAEIAKHARSEGVMEPLVEAVERVAERMKRRENQEPLEPKDRK